MLHVLMLPDLERAERIGEFWAYPESRAFCRASDRLRRGPDVSGGAGRDIAGDPLRTPPRLVDRGMSQSGVRMRHRGTDVAIVACLFLGGSALSMIPLGLLSSLVSPIDIPPWRTGAVLAGALVVGAGMLSLARFLRRGSGWARPVGIAVLAACTLAIGLFTFMVATSPDAGDGAGYALLGGLQVGGFTLAGCIGLATRGSAADFRSLTDRSS